MTLSITRSFSLTIAGQRPIPLELGAIPFTIGRDGSSSIVLADERVSRQHALLTLRDDRVMVRDRNSSNGVLVNGQRLPPGSERALHDGDTLGIGPYQLVFRTGSISASNMASSAPPFAATEVPDRPGSIPPRAGFGRRLLSFATRTLIALALLLSLVAGFVWWFAPPTVSLLILGSDARPGELAAGDRGRTDTLVAYVADRENGRNLLISIPRDLWVQTSATSAGKINTAYRQGGGDAARRAVTGALGIPVDRYLVIGLQGVRDIVDAVGGIDVQVESAIRDTSYPTDDYGITVFELSAGPHHLDGETALRYARTRQADDDLARIARQQQVMVGIRNAISNPLNVWRLPGAARAISQTTETDLRSPELATLVAAYVRAPGPPERLTPSWNMVLPFTAPDGEAALRAKPALREALAALIIGPSTRIEVLNATGLNGVAGQASSALGNQGLKVSRVSTAERTQAESIVQSRSRNRLAAQSIASLLNLPATAMRESGDLPSDVDVRVILGSAYVGP